MDTATYVAQELVALPRLLLPWGIANTTPRGILAIFIYLNIPSLQPLDRLINQAEI